jgi:DNA-binding Lrp family transcriptional regulator
MELSDLEKKILIHIYKYGPDTPWLMTRRLLGEHGWAPKYDEGEVEMACTRLEEAGLLTRFHCLVRPFQTSTSNDSP